jgi:hypothetical protein
VLLVEQSVRASLELPIGPTSWVMAQWCTAAPPPELASDQERVCSMAGASAKTWTTEAPF